MRFIYGLIAFLLGIWLCSLAIVAGVYVSGEGALFICSILAAGAMGGGE